MRSSTKTKNLKNKSCGLCQRKTIRQETYKPYGTFGGKYTSETCNFCGAFRVTHDDWARWHLNRMSWLVSRMSPEEGYSTFTAHPRANPSDSSPPARRT